ncbi:MAG: fumarylacetoacetase [Flavobacteriales bacterium]|jgi:fumarylacetoacetase|tara:strand:+ start:1967 stop:3187 length:1221 start_codon:yes stop_codon:yes gene_type:complete
MIIDIPENSDFSIYNIPFGIFSTKQRTPRAGVAIGNHILDLVALSELGVFDFDTSVFNKNTLNDFISLGKPITNKVRTSIQDWISDHNSPISNKTNLFVLQSESQMHMPINIGDYTDFYSSIEHATNIGTMFRDKENPLLPNWKHIPVGYHGRSSSIVVSKQSVNRPKGQILPLNSTQPVFKATERLDFELEMAFITGKKSDLGESISIEDAEDHIFGLVLLNDWSARDIQKWEYVPLGPFLSKSFASSISPWIVTLEALDQFRFPGPDQNPEVLPYLKYNGKKNYNIELEVSIKPENSMDQVVAKSNFKYLYWNMVQQLTHQSVSGCNINVGDLYGSGTISGKTPDSYGSMLELSWMGTKPIKMKNGSERKFLNDGDTITFRGFSQKKGQRVGFGELATKILPAK